MRSCLRRALKPKATSSRIDSTSRVSELLVHVEGQELAAEITPPPIPGKEIGEEFEKSPLKSKKFVAYLIADIGWFILCVMMLVIFAPGMSVLVWALLLGTFTIRGFIQTGFILGQASLDKFTRIAQINASMGQATPLPERKKKDK